MARLFVPLDVEFATDEKILAARPMAAYLYIVSLAHAKRNSQTNGVIHTPQLPVLAVGVQGRPAQLAATLVSVGLWEVVEGGWRITAWAKHNPSAAQLAASAEIASESGAFGAHQRHHVKEGKPSSKCKYCIDDRVRERHGVPDGVPHWGRVAKEKEEVEGTTKVEGRERLSSSAWDDDDLRSKVLDAAAALGATRSANVTNVQAWKAKTRQNWLTKRQVELTNAIVEAEGVIDVAAGLLCDACGVFGSSQAPSKPANLVAARNFGASAAQSEIAHGIEMDIDGFRVVANSPSDEWNDAAEQGYRLEHDNAAVASVHEIRKPA